MDKKAILLSVKPKYCELIASGEKTIEVRKTRPKIETPFKCYIYCTKSKNKNDDLWSDARVEKITINGEKHYDYVADSIHYLNGSVIGEFVCDNIYTYTPQTIACAKFETNGATVHENRRYNAGACLTADEMNEYSHGKTLYGWHISDLKIYDKPKELKEFQKANTMSFIDYLANIYTGENHEAIQRRHEIKKAPQSWYCVEEL